MVAGRTADGAKAHPLKSDQARYHQDLARVAACCYYFRIDLSSLAEKEPSQ
jgi:hypothetical protein